MEILDKNELENLVDGERKEEKEKEIKESFVDERVFWVGSLGYDPWYANIVNYLVSNVMAPRLKKSYEKKIFLRDIRIYLWDELNLYKAG